MKLYIDGNTGDIYTEESLRASFLECFGDIFPDFEELNEEDRAACTFEAWKHDAMSNGDLTEYIPATLTREIFEDQYYCI